MKRPKLDCVVCDGTMAADLIVGAGRCQPCTSDRLHGKRIEETYGLTAKMYAILLRAQGGKCAICWRKPASKRLAVDHRHSDGVVRGLLCRNCNRNVLGHLRDDTEALLRAVDYLLDPPAIELFGEVRPPPPLNGSSDDPA